MSSISLYIWFSLILLNWVAEKSTLYFRLSIWLICNPILIIILLIFLIRILWLYLKLINRLNWRTIGDLTILANFLLKNWFFMPKALLWLFWLNDFNMWIDIKILAHSVILFILHFLCLFIQRPTFEKFFNRWFSHNLLFFTLLSDI